MDITLQYPIDMSMSMAINFKNGYDESTTKPVL